jgi:hypothetical protein
VNSLLEIAATMENNVKTKQNEITHIANQEIEEKIHTENQKDNKTHSPKNML